MKVRFWIKGKMIDATVVDESARSYLVETARRLFQVPKHSATILEEAIKNDNSSTTMT